jgi:hypothetical protein
LWASSLDALYLGYLQDDEHRHHDVRSVDRNHASQGFGNPTTLEALLSNREEMRLSRLERFKVASVVAASVLQLETTPWLAERWGKRNIIFYHDDSKVQVDYPYLNHLFRSNKRPQTPPAPRKTGLAARFAARDSLSSLGILLLELCFGETIENQHLRKRYLAQDGQSLCGTDYLTARDWAEMVSEEEPALENIIKCCIFCTFEEKADWGNKNFAQAVYESVVEPLEQLVNHRFRAM